MSTETTGSSRAAFLFAPGAGAPSASAWMQEFAKRLEQLGPVTCFDYPYQLEGRRAPDRKETLVRAHGEALEALREKTAGPIVLAGKSMGGRMGCHLAVELGERGPAALICFGYPLVGQNGEVRDQVLRELRTPVLFIQGTRDPMCPLARLDEVRATMQARNELHVIEGGDHSLRVRKGDLKRSELTQDAIDDGIFDAVASFLAVKGLATQAP